MNGIEIISTGYAKLKNIRQCSIRKDGRNLK